MFSDSQVKMCGFETLISGRGCPKIFRWIIIQTGKMHRSLQEWKYQLLKKDLIFFSVFYYVYLFDVFDLFRKHLYNSYCLFLRYVSLLKTSRMLTLNILYYCLKYWYPLVVCYDYIYDTMSTFVEGYELKKFCCNKSDLVSDSSSVGWDFNKCKKRRRGNSEECCVAIVRNR